MIPIPDVHIGEEIKHRFDHSGLTQREFGSRIGMPQQNVARVFNGESIDTKRLAAISRALDFNFFTLFTPPAQISIDGSHNQLNGKGAFGNINAGCDAVLQERIKHLEEKLKDRDDRLREKDERIEELKERIKELKER